MGNSLTPEQFAQTIHSAASNPWLYIGAEAGLTTVFANNTLKTLEGIAKLSDEIQKGLLSEAQKFQKAELFSSGVDALRDLDGNVDGVFDARDAAFSAVQLWQDTNQDGISQASELSRLADHGIVAINLTDQPVNADLAEGNHVASTVVVTHSDGSSTASNLHLLHNPFHRSFDTEVAVSLRSAWPHPNFTARRRCPSDLIPPNFL